MKTSTRSSSRRAVVLAHDLSARGGAERVAVVAASVLRDFGFETVLATGGSRPDVAALGEYFDVDLADISTVQLPSPGWVPVGLNEARETAETLRWTRSVRALHPDLQLNCMFGSTIPGVAKRSIYYVHFPHDPVAPVGSIGRRGYMAFMRALRTLAAGRGTRWGDSYDLYLANSRYTAGHVERLWGRRAEVLYPPCAMIAPGLCERRRWIVGVGRFQDRVPGRPHKRQDVMIEAFANMADLHRDGWQLHLAGSVGSTAELDRLRGLARDLPVSFHPDASFAELTRLYQESSIYWHAQGYGESLANAPLAQEHFGITTVEAMSAGLLPVVFAGAGPAEAVGSTPGTSTWASLTELAEETRRLACTDGSAEVELRASCVERAEAFDARHFREAIAARLISAYGEGGSWARDLKAGVSADD